jgi:MYXO-CTERM domain-containing protein
MRAVALASVALALALAPAASAATAATTLHLYVDPLADFPITPQAPPDAFVVDRGLGLASNTFTCAENPPLARPFAESHTMRGYAYPEPVEVSRGGELSVHPARGVDGDLQFSGDDLVLHWYWAMDPAPGAPGGEQAPLVMPNVVVEATLRVGDAIAIDDASYDQGAVVASGRSQAATLAGPATQGAAYSTVDGQSVYEFTVPMKVAAPLVPRDQGFNLRVDTYMAECGDGRVMPHAVALHSSPGHRPRIEAGIVDPLSGSLKANVTAGTLIVLGQPSSVLGVGDVANVTITVTGPDGQEVEMDNMDQVVQGYGPCGEGCGHRLLYVYLRGLPDPQPGRYNVTMSFTNQQGTASWTQSTQVSVVPEQEAPGLPPVLALAAVVGAALLLRRRP